MFAHHVQTLGWTAEITIATSKPSLVIWDEHKIWEDIINFHNRGVRVPAGLDSRRRRSLQPWLIVIIQARLLCG